MTYSYTIISTYGPGDVVPEVPEGVITGVTKARGYSGVADKLGKMLGCEPGVESISFMAEFEIDFPKAKKRAFINVH